MNIPNVNIRSTHEVLMELMDRVAETTQRNLLLQKQDIKNIYEKRVSFQEILHEAVSGSNETNIPKR